jgi:hypothetical protein
MANVDEVCATNWDASVISLRHFMMQPDHGCVCRRLCDLAHGPATAAIRLSKFTAVLALAGYAPASVSLPVIGGKTDFNAKGRALPF